MYKLLRSIVESHLLDLNPLPILFTLLSLQNHKGVFVEEQLIESFVIHLWIFFHLFLGWIWEITVVEHLGFQIRKKIYVFHKIGCSLLIFLSIICTIYHHIDILTI